MQIVICAWWHGELQTTILSRGDMKGEPAIPDRAFFERIRKSDFGFLKDIANLDSGATSQMPIPVRERFHEYICTTPRGSTHSKNNRIAKEATSQFELAREKLLDFFGAHDYYLAFTSGTTGSSNLLAANVLIGKGDLLLIAEDSHNSQVVSARNFAELYGAEIGYVPILGDGRLDLEYLHNVSKSRKSGKILLNVLLVSNMTGTVHDPAKIREALGGSPGGDRLIYLDGAHSIHHLINLDESGADFFSVSAHKMYGPEGVGALFVHHDSERHIGNMISGGSAVEIVTKESTIYAKMPDRLEAGTLNIEGAIEWGFTVDYLKRIGMERIGRYTDALGAYFLDELLKINGVTLYGPKEYKNRTGIFTFTLGSLEDHEKMAQRLDAYGVECRDGCFCVHIGGAKLFDILEPEEWINAHHGVKPGAVRASLAFYNTLNDVNKALFAIREIVKSVLGEEAKTKGFR
jgi:cysteine desulfurase/selenocysteine lyase